MNTLSFGLPCHASWVQFPTKAKRVSFALSVPRMVNSLQGLAFARQKDRSSVMRCAHSPTWIEDW